MRLRFLDSLRRSFRPPPARGAGAAVWADLRGDASIAATPPVGRHRKDSEPAGTAGTRPAGPGRLPAEADPLGSPVGVTRPRAGRLWRAESASRGNGRRSGAARAAIRFTPRTLPEARPGATPRPGSTVRPGPAVSPGSVGRPSPAARPGGKARPATEARSVSDVRSGAAPRMVGGLGQERRAAVPEAAGLPWYEVAHARQVAAGHRDCGQLELVLRREWAEDTAPPPEAVRAINRLAELPPRVKESLAGGLDAIFVGPGGVPDLDGMGRLHGVPLPSGRATWDACAGAYGDRKIIVGSRPSAAPDVMCHEVGHALDDIDGSGGLWQSDSEDFRTLYARCLPRLTSDFHQQEGALGRREFFADAFSAIASRQRPALVDMLGGDTRIALDVMLYFNVRYGI